MARRTKPAAEVWSHTFGESGPDFVLTVNGEHVGRVLKSVLPDAQPWSWSLGTTYIAVPGKSVRKPMPPLGGEVGSKREAVEALRAAWAIEREWRRQFREMTATTHGCWPPVHLEAAWRGYEPSDDTDPL